MGIDEIHELVSWFGNKVIVLIEYLIRFDVRGELRGEDGRNGGVEESLLL